MTDVLTLTQPVRGCEVTAQGTPDMTVHVAAGFVLVANVVVAVTAGNVTITTADATQDRRDAIVVNSSGTKSAIAGDINDGINVQPPDTTGYALLAYVYSLNQAHPDYTGTITTAAIEDQRDFATVDQPTQSMIYTNAGGSLSDTDPGSGQLGFDGATFGAVTEIYASYFTPSVAHDNSSWLNSLVGPYYLRLFQKSNPANWAVYYVSAVTSHTNYETLTVTPYEFGKIIGVVGAPGGQVVTTLGEENGDLVAERTFMPVGADATGQLLTRTVYTSGTAQTHTFDAAAATAIIRMVGGGGGGGGASTNAGVSRSASGGGGGGAGVLEKRLAVASSTATYTVGGGGTGGTGGTTGGNGNDGVDSTFVHDSVTYTAAKGLAGTGGGTGSATAGSAAGGAAGTATNGDLNEKASPGTAGTWAATAATSATGGDGGASTRGGGTLGINQSGQGAVAGTNGAPYGGGGAGAAAVRAAGANQEAAGGNGADGVIVVDEYS